MIDQTHLHLLSNHLPVFGSLMGLIVLAYGLWTRSNPTKIAAYLVLAISSIGALIAYLTGESAEETVEKLQGVSKEMLETHEDAAQFALYAFIAVGVLSLISIFVTHKKPLQARTFAWVVFLVSLFSFTVVARTAYVGGQIRHSEIRASSTDAAMPAYNEEEDDD